MRIASAIFLLGLLLVPSLLWAETISIEGQDFKVDEIIPVDSENIKVTLNGQSRIIPRSTLEEYVLIETFSSSTDLDFSTLQDFITRALVAGHSERARLAMSALLKSKSLSDPVLVKFVEEIPENPTSQEFFKGLILHSDSGLESRSATVVAVIVRLALSDVDWLRAHAIKFAYLSVGPLKSYVADFCVRALGREDFRSSRALVTAMQQLFGDQDPDLVALAGQERRFSEAIESSKRGKVESLYPLLDPESDPSTFAGLIQPQLVRQLYRIAERSIEAKKPADALLILSRLGVSNTDAAAHEIARKALETLEPAQRSPLLEEKVAALLKVWSHDDITLVPPLERALESQIYFLLRQRYFQETRIVLQTLIVMRPDPNPKNDAIRLTLIGALLDEGRDSSARDLLEEVKTGVPLFTKIRIWCANISLKFDLIGIFIVLVLSVSFIYVLVKRITYYYPKVMKKVMRPDQRRTQQAEEYVERDRTFVSRAAHNLMQSSFDEYSEYLEKFGLDRTADLKTIKAAYRSAVKEHHPDLHRNEKGEVSARFIELTEAYEKIMELRAKLDLDAT